MPTFKGQVDEEELIQLIAFIKSLQPGRDAGAEPTRWPAAARGTPRKRSQPGEMEQLAMSTAHRTLRPASRRRRPPPEPRTNYLNVAYGVKSWLLTTDHKRIALLYLVSVTLMFFLGGAAATLIRLNLMTPDGRPGRRPTPTTSCSPLHGIIMVFFFLIPVIPAVLGNFLLPMMIGATRPGLPPAEPAELVRLHHRRASSPCGPSSPAASIPAGRSTRRSARKSSHTNVIPTVLGIFIAGFSSILTGLNFIVTIHRMRAPGPDLVPPAAVRLVALRHQHHHAAGHAGAGHDADPGRRRAALGHRHLRPGPGRRSGPVPAPVLVLLAPGRLHHDPAGHGRRQRDHPLLLAQEHLRLRLRRLVEHRHRGARLPRLGAPHVRRRPVGLRRHDLLAAELPGGRAVGDQGLQLDGHALQGLGLVPRRRCCSPSASSACSPWAG